MTRTHIKLSVSMVIFLFCLGTTAGWAQTNMAVVLESHGDLVVINRGSQDGVQVGQTWILGEKQGAVLIESAREHSASGRLQGDAEVGMLASLGSASEAANFLSEAQARKEMKAARRQDSRELQRLRKRYKKALGRRTERRGFVTQLQGGGGGIGIPAGQLLNVGMEVYTAQRITSLSRDIGIGSSGFYNPWWAVAGTAVNIAGNQLARRNMNNSRRVRVNAEVILWDPALLDLQTEVKAFEDGLSLEQTLARKAVVAQQKGVDKYTVFEVSLENVGKLPAQTGEFKYRMFLLSNEDRPISASRLDPALDTTLQPGDKVRGMVYFPKIVAEGQDELKVVFEQMYGDRGEMKFRVR